MAQFTVSTGEAAWYFNDHLGTPLIQTSSTATVRRRAEYDPYGRIHTLRTGTGRHQPLCLPGQEAAQLGGEPNGITDRSYNIFHWYRPGWGRYTQADAIGLDGGENLYS